MKRLLYLLPLLTLVFACASRDKDLPEGIEVVPVEREDAAEDASDFLEKIEIVPLETNDSSLIPRPGKMLYSKEMDMYATRTKGIVYTFTGDGKYIGNSKRRMGQGPEDYVMALYMQFNPYLKGIDLLNPYGTVYTYSPTFDLIAKRKCEPEFPLSGFMPIDSVNYMLTYADIWAGEEMLFENIRTHQKSGATYQGTISARNNFEAESNKAESEAFLKANAQNDGVVVTESGLQYKIENPGNEVKPGEKDTVYVYYTGKLIDDTEFDASDPEKDPVKMMMNRVIKGWTEGLQYIGEGGKIKLFIPAELGYGARGTGDIKPNSALIFDVELVKVGKVAEEEKTEDNK